MTSYVTDGTVGPWAHEKLECLGKYLHAYTTILRKQSHWCENYIYVDAFAGGGAAPLRKYDVNQSEVALFDGISEFIRTEEEESETYVNGSPRVALEIQHKFTDYIFVEKNADRNQALQQLKSEYGSSTNIAILQGDANQQIKTQVLEPGRFNWKKSRGLAFLDPFGMQVPWQTLEQLGQTGAFEIILNLPVGMAIQRLLPRSAEFSEKNRAELDHYFGTNEWFEVVYDVQPGLFGEETNKKEDSGAKLALWYRDRLAKAFGFAARPRLITNTRGSHLYYLLWAGPHKVGAKIADEVLRQGRAI